MSELTAHRVLTLADAAIELAEHRYCWLLDEVGWLCNEPVNGQYQRCWKHQREPFTWAALDDSEMEIMNNVLHGALMNSLQNLMVPRRHQTVTPREARPGSGFRERPPWSPYGKMAVLEANATIRELRELFLEQSEALLRRPCAGG